MPDIENLLNIEDEVTQVLSDLGVNEKLNEMDDFMNQNDLKVQITNENAVVTGLVTYTCTVKDKNNTALPNKVVEWYKGTTLIGIDATDSNGVSTFSHRVTEADIYDVHAIVRGTHAGDDIRMFVKDKNNIFTHNVWSGGDYLNSVQGFVPSYSECISVSNEWCVNGNQSIKLNNTKTRDITCRIYNIPASMGDTVSFNIHILNRNDHNITAQVIQNNSGGGQSQAAVQVPSSENEQSITVTKNIDQDITDVMVQISGITPDDIVFIDDLSFIISP